VPRIVGKAIAIREVSYASLAFDHRILDGSTSSRFQNLVKSKVESWRLPD
jgi:pyruvate/2-oxoglutarate dehydrogenase complex dihydrolipoamide acyltransferase (E2) component